MRKRTGSKTRKPSIHLIIHLIVFCLMIVGHNSFSENKTIRYFGDVAIESAFVVCPKNWISFDEDYPLFNFNTSTFNPTDLKSFEKSISKVYKRVIENPEFPWDYSLEWVILDSPEGYLTINNSNFKRAFIKNKVLAFLIDPHYSDDTEELDPDSLFLFISFPKENINNFIKDMNSIPDISRVLRYIGAEDCSQPDDEH